MQNLLKKLGILNGTDQTDQPNQPNQSVETNSVDAAIEKLALMLGADINKMKASFEALSKEFTVDKNTLAQKLMNGISQMGDDRAKSAFKLSQTDPEYAQKEIKKIYGEEQ